MINFPLIPVASAMLPDGKVLVWSGGAVDHFVGGDPGQTWYAVFDPTTDSVGPLQTINLFHDMFCPGISLLANGDVIVIAGTAGGDGGRSTSTWSGSSWVEGPKLSIARGYNSAVLVANGDVRPLAPLHAPLYSVLRGRSRLRSALHACRYSLLGAPSRECWGRTRAGRSSK